MNRMTESDLSRFSSAIWQPEMQQQVFRRLLDGYSYPGRIQETGGMQATAWLAILASLLDAETTLADPHGIIAQDLWPRLEARATGPETAAFILADGSRLPDFNPGIGTLEAPEKGATLLLNVTSLNAGLAAEMHLHLTGPGINTPATLGVAGLHPAWMAARQQWVSAFPLGVDMVLCDSSGFVVLPRTTRIQTGGDA